MERGPIDELFLVNNQIIKSQQSSSNNKENIISIFTNKYKLEQDPFTRHAYIASHSRRARILREYLRHSHDLLAEERRVAQLLHDVEFVDPVYHDNCTHRPCGRTIDVLRRVPVANHGSANNTVRAHLHTLYDTILVHTRDRRVHLLEDNNISDTNSSVIPEPLRLWHELGYCDCQPSLPPRVVDIDVLRQNAVKTICQVNGTNRASLIVSPQPQPVWRN